MTSPDAVAAPAVTLCAVQPTRFSPRVARSSGLFVAAALTLLTGCGAGFDATSRQDYAPSDGMVANSGNLRVLNALVVAPEAGGTGTVSMGVANRGDRADRLTGITSPDGTAMLSGSGEIPAGGAITLGSGTDTSATIPGLSKLPGEAITLEISFEQAQPVRVRTLVYAAAGDYADVIPPATSPPVSTPTSSPAQ